MLSDINEPGPGFEYFLNTPCQEWDAVKYLEALENCKFGLEKATISLSHSVAIHFASLPYFVSNTTATHETSSSHSYGLRLRCWLQLPMELRLRIVMDFASAVASLKTGLVDNFWMKRQNSTKHENMKVNSTFLSCDGIQIGCIEQPSERCVENELSGSAEEVSPVVIPLPDRDRSPTPSYKSGDNSLDDHNKASPSNGHDENEDKNPFITKNEEGSRDNNKFKTILLWQHAINRIDINDTSTNDWVADGHNVSLDFHNFQLTLIKQLETNPTFSYLKDIERILCLSSIMFCDEIKPEFLLCSEKLWKTIRPRPLVPIMLPIVVQIIVIEYNTIINDKQLTNTRWCENWTRR
ncbi:12825_t:CDS:2, partial [Funneliformis mosseae]